MSKKVAILSYLDGFANSSKPVQLEEYLNKDSAYEVTNINTMFLSRLGNQGYQKYLPTLKPLRLLLFTIEAISFLQKKLPKSTRRISYYYPLKYQMQLRQRIISPLLHSFDHVICESPIDSFVFLSNLQNINTIYDCATPLADELYYGEEITKRQYDKFKAIETKVFERVDHLSFHWNCYADYVKKYYKDTGNIFTFDGGTEKKKIIAQYSQKPRVVYLGYLGGYWINLPLLASLSKVCDIDVYGTPAPPKHLGLNYKGYTKPSKLAEYQFGLITISKDRLRCEGFSAKHVEYLSYGLPVFVPEWRSSTKGMGGTIHYNEDNFKQLLKKYSAESNWGKMSKAAVSQADQYEWSSVLKPILTVLEDSNNEVVDESFSIS